MALTITIPYEDTPLSGFESTFFAIHNQLVVTVERKDFAVVDTQDDGSGNTQINVTGTPPALTVGGTVFLNAGTFGSGLCGNFTILSNTGSVIIIDEPFTGAFTGGYVNLITDRPNYYVYSRIQCVYPTILGTFGDIEYIYRKDFVNTKGIGYIDISGNLQSKYQSQAEYDYSGTINQKHHNDAAQFTLEIMEVWDDSTENFSAVSYINAVNAALPIQSEYGSNMVPYVMVQDTDVCLFLRDSERVTHWPELPFDIQFLLSLDIYQYLQDNPGSNLRLVETEKRGSTVLTTNNTNFTEAITLDAFYQRVRPSTNMYTATADHVLMAIHRVLGVQNNRRSEQLYVKLKTVPCNPVYLRWLNRKGGWHYWCFAARQIHGKKNTSLGEFARTFTNIETQNTTSSYLGKDSEPYMLVGSEQMDSYDMELMDSLSDSPFVQILYNAIEYLENSLLDLKWQEVKIDVGDIKGKDTKKTLNVFECKIRMPETQLQRR